MLTFHLPRFFIAGCISAFLLIWIGCKDNSTDSTVSSPSEDDAADVVAASMGSSSSTNGIAAQAAAAVSAASGAAVTADIAGFKASRSQTILPDAFRTFVNAAVSLVDTTVTFSKTSGLFTYNYIFHFQYGFANDSTMNFIYTMHGTYDVPRMSSNDSASAAWILSSIRPASSAYTLNGTYTRNGSQTSKVRDKNSLTTTITLTLSNVLINKSTKLIAGGTAAGTFTGNTTGGRSVQYTVAITFNGNQTATVVINGNNSYSVDMTNGSVN